MMPPGPSEETMGCVCGTTTGETTTDSLPLSGESVAVPSSLMVLCIVIAYSTSTASREKETPLHWICTQQVKCKVALAQQGRGLWMPIVLSCKCVFLSMEKWFLGIVFLPVPALVLPVYHPNTTSHNLAHTCKHGVQTAANRIGSYPLNTASKARLHCAARVYPLVVAKGRGTQKRALLTTAALCVVSYPVQPLPPGGTVSPLDPDRSSVQIQWQHKNSYNPTKNKHPRSPRSVPSLLPTQTTPWHRTSAPREGAVCPLYVQQTTNNSRRHRPK